MLQNRNMIHFTIFHSCYLSTCLLETKLNVFLFQKLVYFPPNYNAVQILLLLFSHYYTWLFDEYIVNMSGNNM